MWRMEMHNTFADLGVTFWVVPKHIEDLIFTYAYDMSRSALHLMCTQARSASFRMPVPSSWRSLIGHDNKFKWNVFLKNPSSVLIDVDAVKQSLSLMNWNAIRLRTNALSHYIRTTTKKSLMVMLDNPITCINPQTVATAIHMVWHILSCCEPQDFRVEAHKNDNYNRFCYIPYFNRPLSAYLPTNRRWTGWDRIAHEHYEF